MPTPRELSEEIMAAVMAGSIFTKAGQENIQIKIENILAKAKEND